MKKCIYLLGLLAVCVSLSGCLVAAAGAGAGAGYYVGDKYEVEKKK